MNIEHKTVLITGANRGIGKGLSTKHFGGERRRFMRECGARSNTPTTV